MQAKKKAPAKKTFRQAVGETPDVKDCFQIGLAGLGPHRAKVELSDTRKCEGSLFIDDCLGKQKLDLHGHRWDYAFSYRGEVFFVEVHTAGTREVDTVIRKLEWLKTWLHHKAPEINKLKAIGKSSFYWVQSNGYHIAKNSKQERRIMQEGIKPISKLALK